MKALTIPLACLALAGCYRDTDGEGASGDDTAATTRPTQVVEAPAVVPMPEAVKYRELPKAVIETTTEDELRVQARIVAIEDLEAGYILREEVDERIAFLVGEWIPALEDLRRRVALARADHAKLAAWEMDESLHIAKYEAEGAKIEAEHYRTMKEDEVKQIRIISEKTYRDLHNLGLRPGCRIGASRPPE